ncbi:uncharacterized protein V1518DRAFT_332230 [Limtongia smithiae]|uniref:uncharacterized protein n=1 Tax=Limtongia smithiae TaxID=1125753 RepID=UPI0034CE7376
MAYHQLPVGPSTLAINAADITARPALAFTPQRSRSYLHHPSPCPPDLAGAASYSDPVPDPFILDTDFVYADTPQSPAMPFDSQPLDLHLHSHMQVRAMDALDRSTSPSILYANDYRSYTIAPFDIEHGSAFHSLAQAGDYTGFRGALADLEPSPTVLTPTLPLAADQPASSSFSSFYTEAPPRLSSVPLNLATPANSDDMDSNPISSSSPPFVSACLQPIHEDQVHSPFRQSLPLSAAPSNLCTPMVSPSDLSETTPQPEPLIQRKKSLNVNTATASSSSDFDKRLLAPCLPPATAAAAFEIANSAKRVRRRKNSISEKMAHLDAEVRPALNTIGSRKPLALPDLPPGKTKDDLDPASLAEYKHVTRLLRNRVAALASREKKRMYMESLEVDKSNLLKQQEEANLKFAQLEKYALSLERMLGHGAGRFTRPAEMNSIMSDPQKMVKREEQFGMFLRPRVEHTVTSKLTQSDFEKLFMASGIFAFLLYLSVSTKYPSYADIPPLMVPPHVAQLQNGSNLTGQIYRVLSEAPREPKQNSFFQVAASFGNPAGTPWWLVTHEGVPDALQVGSTLNLVARVFDESAVKGGAHGYPPSPVHDDDETDVEGAPNMHNNRVPRLRRKGNFTSDYFNNTTKSAKRPHQAGALEELELLVRRRQVVKRARLN